MLRKINCAIYKKYVNVEHNIKIKVLTPRITNIMYQIFTKTPKNFSKISRKISRFSESIKYFDLKTKWKIFLKFNDKAQQSMNRKQQVTLCDFKPNLEENFDVRSQFGLTKSITYKYKDVQTTSSYQLFTEY